MKKPDVKVKNFHECPPSLWRKMSEPQRRDYNALFAKYQDTVMFHPMMVDHVRYNDFALTASHNHAYAAIEYFTNRGNR